MSVEQHSAAHRVPGESLGDRLGARGHQGRRVGASEAFYARFGLTSPWMPDAPVGGAGRDFGMVYLSSAAFVDHMASLSERREARVARFESSSRRFNRRQPSAARRAGVGVRSFSAWGNVGLLGDSDLVVPQHPEPTASLEDEPTAAAAPRRHRGPTMRPVASPWLSFKSTPARVFGGSHRKAAGDAPSSSPTGAPTLQGTPERAPATARLSPGLSPAVRSATPRRVRPLDRMAHRVAAIDVQPVSVAAPAAPTRKPAVSLVDDAARRLGPARASGVTGAGSRRPSLVEGIPSRASVSRRGGAGRAAPVSAVGQGSGASGSVRDGVIRSETAAPGLRAQRRSAVRNARRALGPVARLAATRLEANVPDAAASPLALAASRMPRAGQRARGAQRSLWGSPSAAVLARPVVSTEAPAEERAPVSRSPVRDTWTPARVVRQGPSSATSTARTIQGSRTAGAVSRTAAATSRALARAEVPARPAPIAAKGAVSRRPSSSRGAPVNGQLPVASAARGVAGPGITDGITGRASAAGRATGAAVRTGLAGRNAAASAGFGAVGVRAPRLPATARALDRARSLGTTQLAVSPTGLSAAGGGSAAAGLTAAVARAAGSRNASSSPSVRASRRAEAATPDAGSVLPRPLPALQRRLDGPVVEQSWLDAGFERSTPPAARRLAVARSNQGVFAPAAVVVSPEQPASVEEGTTTPAGARGPRRATTGAQVVSGWAQNELPASTTRVIRGGRPVSPASPARNAERRLQAAARADRADRLADPAGARPTASVMGRTVSAAAARQARQSGATSPAIPRLSRRTARRRALPKTGGVTLQPALAPAAAPADVPRATARAARRASSVPVVGRSAQRALSPRQSAAGLPVGRTRPNPIAHAAPRVRKTVRLTAALARQLGVTRAGAQDRTGGEASWLVSGATAARALSAAQRATPGADAPGSLGARLAAEAVATAARGQVRRSQLWAPDQVTAEASSATPAPQEESTSARRAPNTAGSGDIGSSSVARRGGVVPAGRPLDWLDDRTMAGLSPSRRRALARAARSAGASQGFDPITGTPLAGFAAGAVSRGAAAQRSAGVASARSGSRRGRHLVRTPEGRYIPAARARRASTLTGDFVVPTPASSPASAPVEGRDPVTGAPVVNGWARPQAALSDTLGAVDGQATDAHLPVWARRASGTPLVRGSGGDLVNALARAGDPAEVVRVIMEKGDVGGTIASTLPKPALQIIEKIKTVAREEVSEAIRTEVKARSAAARKAGSRAQAPRSTARVVQGFTGLRRGNSARRGNGVGDGQVMKLAKKLQSLIDLAEGRGDRGAARRQVRMAEDSAAARGEGQSSPASAEGGQESSMDIDALTRQVVEAATRELDQRRERRQEDSDERGFWW